MLISQKAFDMIVAEEVSSKAYYEKHYQRPEWPGLSSGVTVGIGYDLGQASRAKITSDWTGLVSQEMLLVMLSCSGITGNAGKAKCAEVKNKILIPWDAAMKVFANRDVPAWTTAVINAIPGADKLPPSCLGTLVDTAYNRGNGIWTNKDDRYREGRAIRDHVIKSQLALVPGEYQSMKRLWPNTVGLRNRCDHRIALWLYGLKERTGTAPATPAKNVPPAPPVVPVDVPLPAGPARTKPPTTSTAQGTVTGGIVIAGGAAAQQAHAAGMSGSTVAMIVAGAILLAGVVFFIWHKNRNPT